MSKDETMSEDETMSKFQTELLAQLKEEGRLMEEQGRLMKQLIELSQANIQSNEANTEIFSVVRPKPARWISNPDKGDGTVDHICSRCGWTEVTYARSINWQYCPNCGTEMENCGKLC